MRSEQPEPSTQHRPSAAMCWSDEIQVGPESQVNEIEHSRRAGNLLEHRRVLAARRFEVG